MQFAADPREFARSGLPKYGMDLSDDDCEVEPYEYALEDENKIGGTSVKFAEGTKSSSGHRLYNSNDNNNDNVNMIISDHTGNSQHSSMNTSNLSKNTTNRKGGAPSTETGGGGGGGKGGLDALSIIRNEVRETNAARARGDLTGDLDYYQDRGNNRSNNNNTNNKNNTSASTRGSEGERGKYDLFRPLRTAVAYDSELDMESSDEDHSSM